MFSVPSVFRSIQPMFFDGGDKCFDVVHGDVSLNNVAQLVQLALKILAGEPVPPAVYTEHVFIDAGNLDLYYPSG